MKTKHKSLIGIFLFCFFVFTVGFYLYKQMKDFEPPQPIATVGSLPDITFETRQKKEVKLSDFKGKPILLSFWASWCAPCLVELPIFQKLHKEYKDAGLQIVPINLDETSEEAYPFVDRFWKKHGIEFSTFYDLDQSSARKLQLGGLPTNFLLNKNLEVVMESSGLQDWESEKIKRLIHNLVNQ